MEIAMEQATGREEMPQELRVTVARLAAATELLERAVEQLQLKQVTELSAQAEASIERIVATAEAKREAELERKLEFVEAQLETLRASRAAGTTESGRKTLPASMSSLLSKQGVVPEGLEASTSDGGLDTALRSLSIEQRIAVKSELPLGPMVA